MFYLRSGKNIHLLTLLQLLFADAAAHVQLMRQSLSSNLSGNIPTTMNTNRTTNLRRNYGVKTCVN